MLTGTRNVSNITFIRFLYAHKNRLYFFLYLIYLLADVTYNLILFIANNFYCISFVIAWPIAIWSFSFKYRRVLVSSFFAGALVFYKQYHRLPSGQRPTRHLMTCQKLRELGSEVLMNLQYIVQTLHPLIITYVTMPLNGLA